MDKLTISIRTDSVPWLISNIRGLVQRFEASQTVSDRVLEGQYADGQMFTATIEIETVNAAFSELPYGMGEQDWGEIRATPASAVLVIEVCRILSDLADRLNNEGLSDRRLMDINGNAVGKFEVARDIET
ncbi:MAG TPA: hypothetical protein V6C65_23645 [Allocoleopsis sp.]